MPLFNSPERAARKAERQRMFALEEEQARQRSERYKEEDRLRRKRDLHARTGYGPNVGRVDGKGAYGVTVRPDGSVTIGDPDIGDFIETRLAGLHAELETLESARTRVTATRLVALGVLALAVPKRDHRRALVLTGPGGFEAVILVDASDEMHLRQWVASLNREGAQAAGDAG